MVLPREVEKKQKKGREREREREEGDREGEGDRETERERERERETALWLDMLLPCHGLRFTLNCIWYRISTVPHEQPKFQLQLLLLLLEQRSIEQTQQIPLKPSLHQWTASIRHIM